MAIASKNSAKVMIRNIHTSKTYYLQILFHRAIIIFFIFTYNKRCIALKTDMVTASYCTDPMQALHQDAVDAGITVVNEVKY